MNKVYDPACGSGSLLLKFAKVLGKENVRLGFFGPFAIADQAGLDVYANGYTTLGEAYGERLGTPSLISDAVAAGRHGAKNGKGLTGDFDEETKAELIAYRNRAYKRMGDLLSDLGPAPKGTPPA